VGPSKGRASGGLHHLAGLDAPGADEQSLGPAVHGRADLLKIRKRPLLGLVVGVADVVADQRTLATDVALPGHGGWGTYLRLGPGASHGAPASNWSGRSSQSAARTT